MMKKISFLFLLMLYATSIFSQNNPAHYTGSGTAADPYRITTVSDLQNMNLYLGPQYANVYFKLTNGLDLSGVNYSPIGTTSLEFCGHFDGDYREISNLSGNDKSLFRSLAENATVRNLSITNAHITTTQNTVEMGIMVWYNNGTIERCYVQGTITAPTIDNIGHGKGGIVSQNTPTGVVRNCFVNVQLTGRHRLAGISGKNAGTVENCYSTGTLLGTDQINGGVVGHNQDNSLVKNCVNIMSTITGLPATGSMGTYRVYSYAGTGVNNYSLNTTTINGSTITTGTTSNYNGQNATNAQLKTQSFWESIGYDFNDIWVMSDPNGQFQGYPILQGQNVCRYNIYTEADLRKLADEVRAGDSKAGCTYVLMADLNLAGTTYLPIGTVTTVFSGTFEGNYHTISNLSGNDKSLFRSLADNATVRNLSITNAHITTTQTTVEMAILVWYNNGIVENCYVQGSITAPTIDNIGHGKGGIVSQNTPTGVVRNCFVNVQLTGRHRLAGIAGKNAGTVENCYSTGKLLGTDQINGGIVGQNNSLVKSCVNIMPIITGLPATGSYGTYRVYSYGGTGVNNYSLNTTTINGSTISTGTTSNYNGQNATNTQLRTQSFWESIGYDFDDIWVMSDANGPFQGYPVFQWQNVCRHEIYTEADLRNLADEVRAGDSKAGCTYVLMADLNLAGTAYLPIGTVTTVFSGTFEGNYHTISNLSGNDKSLFRSLATNAAVRNLNITNAHITTTQTTVEMAIMVWYNNGLIENCYVQGSITAPTIDNIGHGKGGIVSQNTPTGVVRNCFVNVQLTGRHRLAGISGKNAGTVENCYSTGKLLGTDLINGGVVGHNQDNSLVKNCVNIMPTITGLPATGSYGTYRVYSYGGTGVNNYSLNTTTINGSTVTTGTTSNYNGQNATNAQLRTQSFWEVIGYDFENIWKMSRQKGVFMGYPIFKWQSDPLIFIPGELDDVLEEKRNVQPTIYPNPTNGVVTIGSTNENLDTRVYDIKGQLLLQTDKTTVDLSSYPNGIYIFNINGEIVKIVKQ